jgi:L-iditol 2-dehydrogenase
VEASGAQAGALAALDRLAPRGRLVVIGLSGASSVPIDLDRVVVSDQEVTGSLGSPGVWPQALELLGRGRVRPSDLVTHRFALAEAAEAVRVARAGGPTTGKVLVLPTDADRG